MSPSSNLSSAFPSWSNVVVLVVVVVVFTSSASQACFIRNCPKGGKRSMDATSVTTRPCMACGHNRSGQCVGPNICCVPNAGCYVNTPETEVCQSENQSLTPCYVMGQPCGSQSMGKCVGQGVCCDSESCAMNERCRVLAREDEDRRSSSSRGEILNLIQKLLRVKGYD